MSPAPKVASFHADILFRARLNPHGIAVALGTAHLTYSQFCEHIERMTRRLHQASLPGASRVAVQIEDGYLKWLVNIALARLGLCSVSVSENGRELPLVRPDVVVTVQALAPHDVRVITIGQEWFTRAANDLPPFRDVLQDPSAPCRLVLTSGTTGRPKKILFTYGQLRTRIQQNGGTYSLNPTTRLLVTMGTSSVGGFMMPLAAWRSGATLVLPHLKAGEPVMTPRLFRWNPTVLFMSTAQLGALVESLPPDFWPSQNVSLYVAGSALPRALARKARLRLSQSLTVVYGSTEAGTVALTHAAASEAQPPGFAGYVLPTSEVQIVDEQGCPVPDGMAGEVRIRGNGAANHYLEDEETSSETFRDGWFHPGDSGSLSADGALTLLGRTRELINVGGMKVAPVVIEEALASVPGVSDLAAFAAVDGAGHVRPGLAVVASEQFLDDALLQRYARSFPKLPAPAIRRITVIPRNEMGKVLRSELPDA